MATKESSIVWFIKQFNAYGTENFKTLFKKEIEQAKEIHKQEIIDAIKFGQDNYTDTTIEDKKIAEQYYNETFEI